jgi:hypothetical protein
MGQAYGEQSHRSLKRARKREKRFFVVFGYTRFVQRHAPPWYLYIRKATKGEDRRGCDAFMGTKDAGEIGINIKSSDMGVIWYQGLQMDGKQSTKIAIVPVAESWMDHGECIRDRTFLAVNSIRERLLAKKPAARAA